MKYDFTVLDSADNSSVIFRGIVGSRAYGTANVQSDTDTRVWNPWPEEPPAPEDYCMFLRDAHELPKPLKESGVDLRTCLARHRLRTHRP